MIKSYLLLVIASICLFSCSQPAPKELSVEEITANMTPEEKKKWINQHPPKDSVDLAARGEWWNRRRKLATFLNKYTSGEAERIVTGVKGNNGWEMWRRLCYNYDPNLAVKDAQLMAEFTGMVNKRL